MTLFDTFYNWQAHLGWALVIKYVCWTGVVFTYGSLTLSWVLTRRRK